MKRTAKGLVVVGLSALVWSSAQAVTTRSFNVTSYKELDEGDGEGVLISSDGEVTPGRATERAAVEGDALWTALRAADGTVYAGSLDGGKLIAAKAGKARVLADLSKDSPWIGSLALAGGTLYAGTVATGTIHAVDTGSGKASVLVKLEGADHVWGLVASPDGKTLWAATGPEGKLFAVDVAGKKAKLLWDSEETHLLALARSKDGALWAGTADEAILFRIDAASGQARAAADFAGSEVKAIVEVDGAMVVAVNDFDAKAGTAPAKKPASKGTAAKPPEAGTPGAEKLSGAEAAPRPGERKGKGAVFRVEADGRVEQLHALADGYLQALAAHGGDVYAAAGTGGRVYLVRADRKVMTVHDVEERQVNAVMAWEGGVAFATGDSAAVYTSAGAPKDVKYTSKVMDAGFPARWGNLRFRGQGALTVETRSGNTAKPDSGWSAWQKLGAVSKAADDAQVGAVASPAGRYVQFRVLFAGPAPVWRGATVYYLPQNQRARVTAITVGDEAAGKTPVTLASGAAKPRTPVVKVKWKVDNSDGDELAYTLEMRPEGDPAWRPVPMGPAGEPYGKTEFDWNTESLPDGLYRARVTASDARSNPRELSLSNQLISEPFLVDNGRPVVSGLEVKYPSAAARATDGFSRIDEIAWSVDGGEWQMAYPKDGIFDDVSEAFTLRLPDGLAPGLHTLSVRVADEADNIGAASVTFRVGQGK